MSEVLDPKAPAPVDVKGGVVAYLNLDGALKAADFYVKAFGATIAAQYPPDEQGRTMHVHLYLNDGSLMLGDFYPEHGFAKEQPQAFTLMLQVTDIHTWFKRAVDAGCEVQMPVQKMFWGDIYGQVKDPWGVIWAFNQPDA